ncbi:hypothetical protein EV284_4315 [Streptomyces sp. BK022]|uniref:hypothetical protein n=1 Tax=Streptomyces sp. BK022 TaxID=2512123 RepID=UPI0010289C12|nr:hypothetical protein [Streptomyces sp. BK022]RZU34716.1 hypothetical protein EV284_4315 [Streptomyces sp. BK022]
MPLAGLLPRIWTQLPVLCAISTLFLLFATQLAGALLPNAPVLVASGAAGLALDACLLHRRPALLSALSRIRLDVTVRQLLRDMLIVVALLRIDGIDPEREMPPLLAALSAFYVLHFACQAVALLVRRARTLPVVTRNIDVSALNPTAAPPRILARRPGHRLLAFSVPATAGLLATALTAHGRWGAIGLAASLTLIGMGVARLATWLLPENRAASDAQVMEWLDGWLAEYRPTVAMYFSGGPTSAYQANMWLSTLTGLERPLIVLRERFMVQKIDATDVPVLCLPKVATLFALENSTLKAMLHPANSGKTSQVLRIPAIRHAFVNHGESDKLSSCNPYAKAYDEVWVAGPAARERYALADVGVEDKDVVEVGRPQLAPIRPYSGPPTGAYTTVLYAPTWEGWDGNPGNTSVVLAGEHIVARLLDDPRVRVLYKPHPMTGSVDPRAGAADERIRTLIHEANSKRSGPRPCPEAQTELLRRTHELDRLTSTTFRGAADELERMMLQGTPDGDREERLARATAAWERAYWASFPQWEHRIVTGPRPALYACFNVADLLISDVSSVVSDWLSSEKPYAVANTSGLSEDDFRAAFPTVSAGTVLTPDATTVRYLLDAVRDPRQDRHTADRAKLKEHLLGPADPPSPERFASAVRELCAKSDDRRARAHARLSPAIPAPRTAGDVTSARRGTAPDA